MKIFVFILFSALALCADAAGQSTRSGTGSVDSSTSSRASRPPTFRPIKSQIEEAQEKFKAKGLYAGDVDGKYNDELRSAIRKFQADEGIAQTGNLNRITLERLKIGLTEVQQQIPIPANTMKPASSQPRAASSSGRTLIFRATKDQVFEAQKTLRAAGVYDGENTGKLDPETRAGLRKYQALKEIKVTGTLNQQTLATMGIALTPAQEANEKK